MAEGGYVVAMVFRGDNTSPKFNEKWSPLHNRCLALLAELDDDGMQLFWDNLYPSLDIVQEIAGGGEYEATIPFGPEHGKTVKITVPKVLSEGTARTNRGVPKACLQPSKKSLTAKQLEELKAKPAEERLKVKMTESEPNVLCISFFDNAGVHLLSTIHKDAKFTTIHRRRWDGKALKVAEVPIKRLEVRPPDAATARRRPRHHRIGSIPARAAGDT